MTPRGDASEVVHGKATVDANFGRLAKQAARVALSTGSGRGSVGSVEKRRIEHGGMGTEAGS